MFIIPIKCMNLKMKEIQNLLNQVSIITKKNAEFLDATGGRFNMFKMLGVDHYENTHSAILAELLNPKGSHGLKNEFLKLFVSRLINKETISGFNSENASIRTEAGTDDGRIDIFIKDNQRHAIIIENKIYAADQLEQLKRYNKSALKDYGAGNYQILYLTLDGKDASPKSGEEVIYERVSYSIDIIDWLEECVNLSARFPLVRETIFQYINHLKQLTNQDMDTKNREEIVRILASSKDNLQGAFTIFENNGDLKNYLIANYFIPQLKEIANDLHLKVSFELMGRGKNASFKFEVPEWSIFNIEFTFDESDCRSLNYYFNIDVERRPSEITVQELSPKFKVPSKNPKLPCGYSYLEKYRNWNSDAYFAIYSGEMKEEIKRIVTQLKDWAEGLEM